MNTGRPSGPPGAPVPPRDPEAGETRNLAESPTGSPDAPTRSTTDAPSAPRPQAYSAVDVGKEVETALTPLAPASSAPAASASPATPSSSPTDAARSAATPDEEVSVGAQRAAARPPARTNTLSVWAMVLSVLGCTSPIGLFLGYRARGQIQRTREYGSAFATVAIVVGWTYIVAILVALIAYLLLWGLG